MAEILSLQTVADPAAAVGRVVAALRAGKVVALPGESTYRLAASALAIGAVRRLPSPAGTPLTVGLRAAGEARDWAPELSPLGQRLARRTWPGPVILATAAGVKQGLASWLPDEVRSRVSPAETIHLQAPAQRLTAEVLRNGAGPLLFAPIEGTTGEQVLEQGNGIDLVVDAGPCASAAPATIVAVNERTWHIVRAGAFDAEQIRQRAACVIVFVCTGNTCRSPLAEALFKKQLAERLNDSVESLPNRGFFVLSAGLAAMMGGGAAAEAVATASALARDLSAHYSRLLTAELAAQADYLVAMTSAHRLAVLDQFPELAAVPRLLDPAGKDLPDPIGQDQEVYEACGRQIWECVQPLVAEVAAAGVPSKERNQS